MCCLITPSMYKKKEEAFLRTPLSLKKTMNTKLFFFHYSELRLADDQLLDLAELVVGDTDEVSTLGKTIEVDNLRSLSIDVLVVNHAAAHVDEHAVHHAADTLDVQVDLRSGGVGLEVHADIGGNGIDALVSGILSEGEGDSVVALNVSKRILVGKGILTGIFNDVEVSVTSLSFFIPSLNGLTVNQHSGDTARESKTGNGSGRTVYGVDSLTADRETCVCNFTEVFAFAGHLDIVTLNFLTRTNNHADHRIVVDVPAAESTIGSERIIDIVLILVDNKAASILGSSLVVGKVDDGVIGVGASGRSHTVVTQSLVSKCEVCIFLHAVTNTIARVGFESGLLGEVDIDSVVVTKGEVTSAVTANDGAVVHIAAGDFLHIGTGVHRTEANLTAIILVIGKVGRDSGTSVVVASNGRSNQLDTVDNPIGRNFSVGGEAGGYLITGIVVVDIIGILGDVPITLVDVAKQVVVVRAVGENTIVMAPTILGVVVVGTHNLIIHGVVVDGEAVGNNGNIQIVVAKGLSGEVNTRTVRSVVNVAIPTTILERVNTDPTSAVDIDGLGVPLLKASISVATSMVAGR